jgi:hypothetical protein
MVARTMVVRIPRLFYNSSFWFREPSKKALELGFKDR